MRKREFQFLTINTPSLWEEFWENKEESKEYLDITGEGISLHEEYIHAFGKNFKASLSNPIDFALDSCGILYILDIEKYNVLIEAIAISPSNLYIADTSNHRVQTFARINSQIRWIVGPLEDSHGKPLEYPEENPLAEMEPIDIVLDAQENLYVLDIANLLIQKFDQGGRFLGVIGEGLENPIHLVIKDIYLYVLESEKK